MSILATVDNVKEVSVTTGTSSFVLGGAVMGSQSWSAAYPSGGNVYYFASEVTLLGTPGKTWELGIGALSAGVLARTTILASSNGGAIARFPGPSTYVSSTIPLSALSGVIALPNGSTAVTQAPGDNTTQISTDAFVQAAVAAEAVLRSNADTSLQNQINALLSNYLTPINNTSASSDLSLGVGQSAFIKVSAGLTVPLHIATASGQVYEVSLNGQVVNSAAQAYLNPNNTNYGSVFFYREVYGADTTIGANAAAATVGILLSIGSAQFETLSRIFTNTVGKSAISMSGGSSTIHSYVGVMASEWQDTSTLWSSLGSISFGAQGTGTIAWTGTIFISRVA